MSNTISWPLSFGIAHRGASQLAPENTLVALKIAKEKGARWVECDVQLTRDHVPVIFHDALLKRTTNGRGLLSATSFQKIQSLDAGSWFSAHFKNERVPTLQEWLTCCVELNLGLNLEMKVRTKKRATLLTAIVMDQLKKYWPADFSNLLISSANRHCLSEVNAHQKAIPLGFIYLRRVQEKMIADLQKNNIVSIHQPFSMFTEKYCAMLQSHHLRALAFTVNDRIIADHLKAIGVDGIFTDDNALFNEI